MPFDVSGAGISLGRPFVLPEPFEFVGGTEQVASQAIGQRAAGRRSDDGQCVFPSSPLGEFTRFGGRRCGIGVMSQTNDELSFSIASEDRDAGRLVGASGHGEQSGGLR
jgi:hypothetical protein